MKTTYSTTYTWDILPGRAKTTLTMPFERLNESGLCAYKGVTIVNSSDSAVIVKGSDCGANAKCV